MSDVKKGKKRKLSVSKKKTPIKNQPKKKQKKEFVRDSSWFKSEVSLVLEMNQYGECNEDIAKKINRTIEEIEDLLKASETEGPEWYEDFHG